VTDVVSRSHTWAGIDTESFQTGIERAAELAAKVFLEPASR
jgi:hypothetical protein